MEWMLFAALVVLALFGFYQMAVSHGEEMVALKSRAEYAEARMKLLKKALKRKNEYIKLLERSAVENADPATITRLLNNVFLHEDEDSVPEPVVPGGGSPEEARTVMGFVRRTKTLP